MAPRVTLPYFDKCMHEMEQRLQAEIGKFDEITLKLARYSTTGLDQAHVEKADNDLDSLDIQLRIEKKFQSIDDRLVLLASAVEVDPKAVMPESYEDEDLKRLKEKLKEALKNEKYPPQNESEKEPWLEYIFGICKADGRIGKKGSRCVSRPASIASLFSRDTRIDVSPASAG